MEPVETQPEEAVKRAEEAGKKLEAAVKKGEDAAKRLKSAEAGPLEPMRASDDFDSDSGGADAEAGGPG